MSVLLHILAALGLCWTLELAWFLCSYPSAHKRTAKAGSGQPPANPNPDNTTQP